MLRLFAPMIFSGVCAIGLGSAAFAEPQPAPIRVAQAAPQAQPKAKAAPAAPAPAADDSALKQRVEQLEEQLVDMQVVVGTLESLARGGGAPAASGAGGAGFSGGADSVRLDGLETQMRALSAQIQQLTDQVRALGGQPRRSDAGSATTNFAATPVPGSGPASGSGADAGAPPPTSAADAGRFGSTTVTAGNGGDSIGGLIESEQPAAEGGAAASPSPEMAALPPAFGAATAPNAADAGNAKQLYETAYGYLMQRDYTAAASSFLKGYQNYAGNARAADSLLKLAMSLDRLGQKDAACSSFGELSTRFPNAPENVKNRAKSERQRIGCT
jgi:TolA-binding protein